MTGAAVRRRARGFTLVEALVALAIVAIALAAGARATAALTRNTMRHADLVLAQLCAENELVKARLLRQLPPIGDAESTCTQGEQTLRVSTAVRPTPNPNFRRVDARVWRDDTPVLNLSTVIGRY